MSKYDNLKIFKKTKARTSHFCIQCGKQINVADFYYAEMLKDKFLHSLHMKKLCQRCYQNLNK